MAIKIQGTDVISDSRELVNIPNLPQDIEKPQPVSPADNATDIGEEPTLDGGTYYSLYGLDHQFSRFQVSDDSSFSNIVYDSGEISGTETHDVPAGNLSTSTTYYWRVYYKDSNGFQSEFSDAFEFTTSASFLPDIGDAFAGGFFVGVIDTVAGTIDSQDDYQTGERYALVVSPKEYEGGRGSSPASGLPTGDLDWDNQKGGPESGLITRWNGLEATNTIINKNQSRYEVFNFIADLRNQYPAPSINGGSNWYLPALDELELIYRNFKPTTDNNELFTTTATFPSSTQSPGFNPSSDPNGNAYTSSNPSQTTIIDFQENNSQSLDNLAYWSSTDPNATGDAWFQNFNKNGVYSLQQVTTKQEQEISVRPVRRVLL